MVSSTLIFSSQKNTNVFIMNLKYWKLPQIPILPTHQILDMMASTVKSPDFQSITDTFSIHISACKTVCIYFMLLLRLIWLYNQFVSSVSIEAPCCSIHLSYWACLRHTSQVPANNQLKLTDFNETSQFKLFSGINNKLLDLAIFPWFCSRN